MAHVVPIEDLADPRLADYSHRTDVALRKAAGAGHGIYLAESALVLERALRAGHAPRSVLALGGTVDEALALVGDRDVPVFTGPGELLAELTGYVLHRGVVASLDRPALPTVASLLPDARRVVVLEDVVDPTNVGAIFRSVGAIGAVRCSSRRAARIRSTAAPSASAWAPCCRFRGRARGSGRRRGPPSPTPASTSRRSR